MVQFNGQYKHIKNENFVPFLIALGYPEDVAKFADESRFAVEWKVDGDKIVFTSETHSGSASHTFTVGQEVDEKLSSEVVLKSTAKIDRDTITIDSITPTGLKYIRVYKFTDSGFEITGSSPSSEHVTKRYYQRL